MNSCHKYLSASLLATVALLAGISPASAQVALGAASGFSILGGTAVTCTDSVVTGDVGVSPGTAFTNTRCTIAGRVPPATNAAAAQAQAALSSAYAAIQARPCIAQPGNLAGVNLAPGTYCLDASAKAGTLTLTGNSNDVWIFRVDGALTGTNFTVVMAGGGQPCNVFWAPSAAATMTASAFKGTILAGNAIGGSITLTGGSLAGRALAKVAVTMTGASVVIGCGVLSGADPADPVACKDRDDDRDDDDKDHGKKHRHHDKDHGKKHGHHDKDHGKKHGHHDKDRGHTSSPF